MIIHPGNNYLTFSKVNLQPRQGFEAKQNEFKIGKTCLIELNQDDRVIWILEVGNTTGEEVRDHRRDVLSQSRPGQHAR